MVQETVIQALNTIVELHFKRILEKKREVDAQKKEMWHLFQIFFLFLAVLLAAQLRASSPRLQCRHCWVPIGRLSLGRLVFYIVVAQTLCCINGFPKAQPRPRHRPPQDPQNALLLLLIRYRH
ncbi:hypothetical protein Cni_G13583 [Canna indica]|uniref:Uncharacterized protein n=1 Tax=Canna indica TaxID=4628 RepID=A0AAQ3QCU9_9LILI|nr:hypothetical protein Cni_G13583 [Canna indica]